VTNDPVEFLAKLTYERNRQIFVGLKGDTEISDRMGPELRGQVLNELRNQAPSQEERPNVRTGDDGGLIVDLKDDLSAEEKIKRLDKVVDIVEDSENLEEAQEIIDEEFSDE